MTRLLSIVLTCLLWSVPVYGDFPSLTGMFDHAAGYTTDARGNHVQWAWSHEAETPDCTRLYMNTGTWFDWSTGWYERFCVVGPWVRLMGWTSRNDAGDTVFLALKADGENGQPYAKVDATEPYAFSVEVELWFQGQVSRTYLDTQTWAPTLDGWSQQETFRWLTGPDAGRAFQSFVVLAPRSRFDRVWNSFITPASVVIHGDPMTTPYLWTW